MEKRLFLALAITFLFFLGYSFFLSKYAPQQQPKIEQVLIEEPLKKEPRISEIEKAEEKLELAEIKMDNFVVTYSPRGGYIRSLKIRRYDEEMIFKNIGFTPAEKDKKFNVMTSENALEFTSSGVKKEFLFAGPIITINYSSSLSPPGEMVIFSNPLAPSMLDQRYQEFFYKQKDLLQRAGFKKVKPQTLANVKFAGARDRYYCASLLPHSYDIRWIKDANEILLAIDSPGSQISIYVGPQIKKELAAYNLQEIIYYGFFHGIGVVMGKLLTFFYLITRNWGFGIILLSMGIYGLLFPFSRKSTQAMKKMQQLQPEVEELKKKHKDNPQKLNKEIMELYKKYKVNPLGGCLPLFFQFPIFIALYQVLLRFVELKGAHFLWIKDLTLPDRAFMLPFSLPLIKNYINILPILIMILGVTQQKISVSSASSQQKSMGLFFALFIGVIFYNFPSAIVLYWLVQNLFMLMYQYRISRA
ncbi:MAG: membrane protein insertase YidC [Candidatus Omnitrophota bacterium]|nr:MAG: membrane protein insertase YidC [Candidatus Omnitrophota bacterium]